MAANLYARAAAYTLVGIYIEDCLSVFIVLIFSVIFAKTYFSNAVVGKVWDLFEYLWTAVGGLFVK